MVTCEGWTKLINNKSVNNKLIVLWGKRGAEEGICSGSKVATLVRNLYLVGHAIHVNSGVDMH